jgi:hypothetical protein
MLSLCVRVRCVALCAVYVSFCVDHLASPGVGGVGGVHYCVKHHPVPVSLFALHCPTHPHMLLATRIGSRRIVSGVFRLGWAVGAFDTDAAASASRSLHGYVASSLNLECCNILLCSELAHRYGL